MHCNLSTTQFFTSLYNLPFKNPLHSHCALNCLSCKPSFEKLRWSNSLAVHYALCGIDYISKRTYLDISKCIQAYPIVGLDFFIWQSLNLVYCPQDAGNFTKMNFVYRSHLASHFQIMSIKYNRHAYRGNISYSLNKRMHKNEIKGLLFRGFGCLFVCLFKGDNLTDSVPHST